MPEAEVVVDESLVAGLVSDQYPDLAGAGVTFLANGWDNVSFRVGEAHVARLPRREAASRLVESEARWLPDIASRLTTPIPAPVFLGEPARGYPWHWAIAPFLPGVPAAIADEIDPGGCARDLGRFVAELHVSAPDDAPENPFRGVPLAERDRAVRDRIASLEATIPAVEAEAVWDRALAAPPHAGPKVWLHGDLHPLNILVSGGRVSAVVDFGDITAGDPATDLAIGWLMFDKAGREQLFEVAGASGSVLERARGWALAFAVAYLSSSADNPVMHRIGDRALASVLEDAGGVSSRRTV